ncbi:DUF5959 family protein [Streptomyces tendae]|uniref:DUF5959 family protein n=1 Tax=Streptomyces tendae TaxID=1932 RepID=UPI0036F9625B
MESTQGVINLIDLAETPGTSGRSVSVRVLGRFQPGILTGHDFLDCEIVIVAESVNATFPVTLLPEDLEDWEDALADLASGRSAVWLDSGRTPSMSFTPDSGGLLVSVHDGPETGVTATVPLFVVSSAWVDEQRDLLMREIYPSEVVETSPNAYKWRRATRS